MGGMCETCWVRYAGPSCASCASRLASMEIAAARRPGGPEAMALTAFRQPAHRQALALAAEHRPDGPEAQALAALSRLLPRPRPVPVEETPALPPIPVAPPAQARTRAPQPPPQFLPGPPVPTPQGQWVLVPYEAVASGQVPFVPVQYAQPGAPMARPGNAWTGNAWTGNAWAAPRQERAGAGYLWLALLGLLGGVVGYFTLRDRDPARARQVLGLGAAVTGVSLLLYVVLWIVMLSAVSSAIPN